MNFSQKYINTQEDIFQSYASQCSQLGLSAPISSRVSDNRNKRSRTEIPVKFRSIFHFEYFNKVQSQIFDDAYNKSKPIVVSAPTGAGKTVIFELAILHMLIQAETSPNTMGKIIYMAPLKALCAERAEDWNSKFSPFGITCGEITGDSEVNDFSEMQRLALIATTPEKWDSMTRRKHDHEALVQEIKLFLIDEVHILNECTRGATIEAVISRMKSICGVGQIRFIAVSATIPNPHDIAEWLSTPDEAAACFEMGDDYRSVPLIKVVMAYPHYPKQSIFQFDANLNFKLPQILLHHAEGKPALIFCMTRKSCMQACQHLAKTATFSLNQETKFRLQQLADTLVDTKLKDDLKKGVAYHHAGVNASDRKIVEQAFLEGILPVLLCTSTLAMGVNLPARLVVIKCTQHYATNGIEEYPKSQILQMIGRAGRPQFDTHGTAVIMTTENMKTKYQHFIDGQEVIESSLHENLIEHLNAEIVLQTVTNISQTIHWLRNTFLYVRAKKNPRYYKLPGNLNTVQLEQKLQEMCIIDLKRLTNLSLIVSNENNYSFTATETGCLMARYCMEYKTMELFSQINGTESLENLLTFLAECAEFKDVVLRMNERTLLNNLNKNKNKLTIRFPINGKIQSSNMKVNCLLQADLGGLSINDFSLQQDLMRINRVAVRIVKCLTCLLWCQPSPGADALKNAILLSKCLEARVWDASGQTVRQLHGVGLAMATALETAGFNSLDAIERADPRHLEQIIHRHPPFGNNLIQMVQSIPKYELSVEQFDNETTHKSTMLEFIVRLMNPQSVVQKTGYAKHFIYFIVANDANEVLFKAKIRNAFLMEQDWNKKIQITRHPLSDQIHTYLISNTWVGRDIQSTFSLVYQSITGPSIVQQSLANVHLDQKQQYATVQTPSKIKQQPPVKARQTPKCKTPKKPAGIDVSKEKILGSSQIPKTPGLMRSSQLPSTSKHFSSVDPLTQTPTVPQKPLVQANITDFCYVKKAKIPPCSVQKNDPLSTKMESVPSYQLSFGFVEQASTSQSDLLPGNSEDPSTQFWSACQTQNVTGQATASRTFKRPNTVQNNVIQSPSQTKEIASTKPKRFRWNPDSQQTTSSQRTDSENNVSSSIKTSLKTGNSYEFSKPQHQFSSYQNEKALSNESSQYSVKHVHFDQVNTKINSNTEISSVHHPLKDTTFSSQQLHIPSNSHSAPLPSCPLPVQQMSQFDPLSAPMETSNMLSWPPSSYQNGTYNPSNANQNYLINDSTIFQHTSARMEHISQNSSFCSTNENTSSMTKLESNTPSSLTISLPKNKANYYSREHISQATQDAFVSHPNSEPNAIKLFNNSIKLQDKTASVSPNWKEMTDSNVNNPKFLSPYSSASSADVQNIDMKQTFHLNSVKIQEEKQKFDKESEIEDFEESLGGGWTDLQLFILQRKNFRCQEMANLQETPLIRNNTKKNDSINQTFTLNDNTITFMADNDSTIKTGIGAETSESLPLMSDRTCSNLPAISSKEHLQIHSQTSSVAICAEIQNVSNTNKMQEKKHLSPLLNVQNSLDNKKSTEVNVTIDNESMCQTISSPLIQRDVEGSSFPSIKDSPILHSKYASNDDSFSSMILYRQPTSLNSLFMFNQPDEMPSSNSHSYIYREAMKDIISRPTESSNVNIDEPINNVPSVHQAPSKLVSVTNKSQPIAALDKSTEPASQANKSKSRIDASILNDVDSRKPQLSWHQVDLDLTHESLDENRKNLPSQNSDLTKSSESKSVCSSHFISQAVEEAILNLSNGQLSKHEESWSQDSIQVIVLED